ncbi:MAG: hypothetical protein ACF8XB_03715 [Planctomycetota bacterium JB042]
MDGSRRWSWRDRAGLLLVAATLGACSFEHAIGVDYEETITKRDGHEVAGFVHAETWTPAFLYVLPLLPRQSPERAQELAIAKAKAMGADGVTDVRLHVETHMPFLFLAGWTENHVSATAVRHR